MVLCGILHPRRRDWWCVKKRYHKGHCTNGAVCWEQTTHITRMQDSLLVKAIAARILGDDCSEPIYVDG